MIKTFFIFFQKLTLSPLILSKDGLVHLCAEHFGEVTRQTASLALQEEQGEERQMKRERRTRLGAAVGP